MEYEALEVEFAYASEFWTNLEIGICKITNAVSPFEKPNRRVEVRTDLPVIGLKVEPIRSEDQPGTKVGLPSRQTGCSRFCREAAEDQILEKNRPSIDSTCLVEAASGISETF